MESKRKMRMARFVLISILIVFSLTFIFAADPVGPDALVHNSNSTKSAVGAQTINISGGYIANYNLTASIQSTSWKAFIGNVVGSFTLDDSAGATIYDWTLSSVTGRVYSTRNSSTIDWSSISCASISQIESENVNMNLTNNDTNITATFDDSTHGAFWVGATQIGANSCSTLNTYVNNATQDTTFEEMVLSDSGSIVYATILEEDATGYNGETYDFQMLVPEFGTPGFSGSTAYYLYVEIGN